MTKSQHTRQTVGAAFLLCGFLIAPGPGRLVWGAPLNPVSWKIEGVPAKGVKPGAKFSIRLVGQIEPGWHMYSMKPIREGPIATSIWIAEGQPFLLDGGVRAPRPETVQDPNFNVEVEFYEGEVVFGLPVKVVSGAEAGAQTLTVNTSYQSCNEKMCLPPRTVKVSVLVDVRK